MLGSSTIDESTRAMFQEIDTLGSNTLSVAIVGPEGNRREALARAVDCPWAGAPRSMPFYPSVEQISELVDLNYDVVMIDLDSNPEVALDLVETLCARSQTTVMVYSAGVDPDVMIRCMRAGARELLTMPLASGTVAEAMVRAAVRRSSLRSQSKSDGKLFVFWGAKGGAGVTTIATAFAVAAAKETGQKTLLIDLDLPFGDVALGLGLTPQYSSADAVQNHRRLDSHFLSRLITKHSSGLFVLGSPGKLIEVEMTAEGVDKLIATARQEFDHVVVDSGSRLDLTKTSLFGHDSVIYLVSQVGISELRNSNRLVTEFFKEQTPKLEIVLNRYSTLLSIDEEHITKAITRQAQWKIPDDTVTLRKLQNAGTPLAESDSALTRMVRQMARSACGIGPEPDKKKKLLGIF